jgi:hypothetical protein
MIPIVHVVALFTVESLLAAYISQVLLTTRDRIEKLETFLWENNDLLNPIKTTSQHTIERSRRTSKDFRRIPSMFRF